MQVAGVFVVSAIPFAAVKGIANSRIGEWLQRGLERRKKLELDKAATLAEVRRQARDESLWYGAERPRWLGPIPYEYPAYLRGEVAGDYGFDVAGLAEDPQALQAYYK